MTSAHSLAEFLDEHCAGDSFDNCDRMTLALSWARAELIEIADRLKLIRDDRGPTLSRMQAAERLRKLSDDLKLINHP